MPGPAGAAHVRVAIAGAGFGGLGAAIRLLQAGERDLVVLERADDMGGTWRDNSYPGCACDVPSVLYSFSFAPNPGWTRSFSRQPEIWAYLQHCVERFGLRPYLRFGVELEQATWDGAAQRWVLRTSAGEPHCRHPGRRRRDRSASHGSPTIPGLDSFEGTVFHSARWRHDHDLTGRDVAVVGTGASADAVRAPDRAGGQAADGVPAHPALGRAAVGPGAEPLGARGVRRFPVLQRLARTAVYGAREPLVLGLLHPRFARVAQRAAERHLRNQVPDPRMRAALTPDYALGCKRILISSDYLPALSRPTRRPCRQRRWPASGRARWSVPTAPSIRPTRSSSAPAST